MVSDYLANTMKDSGIDMSNLHEHALIEFRAAGWLTDDGYTDGMQEAMCKHILKLLDIFADEGHSGSSAPYAIGLFSRLAKFKPIAPLTGADDEWTDISAYGDDPRYQNKRLSSVFKDADGECYNIDGKVFWEWCMPYEEGGEPYKSYYSSRESRVPVTFPYNVPDKPEYVYRQPAADPQQPPQDENGFL
jgi:hypothetical protein